MFFSGIILVQGQGNDIINASFGLWNDTLPHQPDLWLTSDEVYRLFGLETQTVRRLPFGADSSSGVQLRSEWDAVDKFWLPAFIQQQGRATATHSSLSLYLKGMAMPTDTVIISATEFGHDQLGNKIIVAEGQQIISHFQYSQFTRISLPLAKLNDLKADSFIVTLWLSGRGNAIEADRFSLEFTSGAVDEPLMPEVKAVYSRSSSNIRFLAPEYVVINSFCLVNFNGGMACHEAVPGQPVLLQSPPQTPYIIIRHQRGFSTLPLLFGP